MTTGGPADTSTTLAIWSYREAFGTGQPDFSPAAAVGNLLILIALRRRIRAPAAAAPQEDSRPPHDSSAGAPDPAKALVEAALGLLLTALMLFPVYWMVNVSLTRTSDMRADPPHWFPWDPTFEGYAAALGQQLPALGHQPAHRPRHGRAHLVVALPAGYALAKLRPRGGRAHRLPAAGRADDPRRRHGDGLLRHLHQARDAQHRRRPDRRRLDAGRAVRRAAVPAFMAEHPAGAAVRPRRWTARAPGARSARSSCR